MNQNTIDSHRNYWNSTENTERYELNNFSIFDDPKAKAFLLRRMDIVLYDRDSVIADLGCGPGHILPYLSQKAREVIVIDYAENMLCEAQKRNPTLTNITYRVGDLRNLVPWYGTFDTIIATNCILPCSVTEAETITQEIFKSLKCGGALIAVMPSMETCIYLARLKLKQFMRAGVVEESAMEKIRKEFEQKKKFDGLFGFMRDDEHNLLQKYFYADEIELMLGNAGFTIKTIEKVRYTWEHCRKYGYGYFPNVPEIYDWYVLAEKN